MVSVGKLKATESYISSHNFNEKNTAIQNKLREIRLQIMLFAALVMLLLWMIKSTHDC